MKLESLVITGQLYCGEYVLKSCTRVAMRSSMPVGANPTEADNIVLRSEISEPIPQGIGLKGEISVL